MSMLGSDKPCKIHQLAGPTTGSDTDASFVLEEDYKKSIPRRAPVFRPGHTMTLMTYFIANFTRSPRYDAPSNRREPPA